MPVLSVKTGTGDLAAVHAFRGPKRTRVNVSELYVDVQDGWIGYAVQCEVEQLLLDDGSNCAPTKPPIYPSQAQHSQPRRA